MAHDEDETSDAPLHDDDPPAQRPRQTAADEILGDTDAPATADLVPETQGEEPLAADLGEEGQGDLAPEDRPDAELADEITRLENDGDQGAV